MKKTVCIWLAVFLLLSACAPSAAATWQEQYDLGVRYLSEGNYREAIIAFNAAIEIDPKRADAYIGLADAYEAQGDLERARQVLEDALAVVADADAIRSRLDGLEGNAAPEITPESTPEPTPEPTPTSTPPSTIVASGDCGENVVWTLDSDGTLVIEGTGPMDNYGSYTGSNASFGSTPWKSYSTEIHTVVIGNGVTTVGVGAFRNTDLTSVIIPDSVISIGGYAFDGCSSLTGVTIPDSVTSIGARAFSGTPWQGSMESMGEFAVVNSILIAYQGNGEDVTISDSVASIGERAFAGCSLTSVAIPDSVTSIGNFAFHNCGSLTSVTIGNNVTSIGSGAFNKCSSLTGVTIPDSVISIGRDAFQGCNSLESVTIPASVTSIGNQAFYWCFHLTDVYYGGSAAQWNQITIGGYNDPLLNATIHYNS